MRTADNDNDAKKTVNRIGAQGTRLSTWTALRGLDASCREDFPWIENDQKRV